MECEVRKVKHIMLSIFVILFTLTCCILMYSFKIPEVPVNIQQSKDLPKMAAHQSQKNENKEAPTDISHDNQQKLENKRANDDYNESDVKQDYDKEDSSEETNYISLTYESTSTSSVKYEAAAMEAQRLLTFKEKLYLIGIARYLDSRDFSLIKKYIFEGATQKELDGLWEQIGDKLPEDDYAKVYAIFLKYKN
jgi:hypothetical protein